MDSRALQPFRPRAKQTLRFRSMFNQRSGYGLHGQAIVRSFLKLGYAVNSIAIHEPEATPDVMATLIPDDPNFNHRELVLATTDFEPGPHQWLFSMYETTRLPVSRAKALARARALIVPCRWNAECWNAQGLDAPIYVAPLGFNPDSFYPASTPADHGLCVFGAGGNTAISGVERKNLKALVSAFCAAFPSETDVRLVIKLTEMCPLDLPSDNRISVVRGQLTEQDMGQWLRHLTAFVSPSKAEAFNFFNLQAMACGVPLICCDFGGVRDYFSEEAGYALAYDLVPPRESYDRLGLWAEPKVMSLLGQLRRVYENRTEAAAKGARAVSIASAFTWDIVNAKLAGILHDTHYWEPAKQTGARDDVDLILRFYGGAVGKRKSRCPDDLATAALSNTPRGLGDTVLLSHLPRAGARQGKPRFIHCRSDEHVHFDVLNQFNPYYLPAGDRRIVCADVLQHSVDMGNGHFMQRLQRAFGLEPEIRPAGCLVCPDVLKKQGRVLLHFDAGAPHASWQRLNLHPRARQLYPENRAVIQEFINSRPDLEFIQVGHTLQPFESVDQRADLPLAETIRLAASCEWFMGIISGPMHLATALGAKCVVVINFPPAALIYLPTLVDIDQVESEWFYPQNVHLHQDSDGPLVPRFTASSLAKAFAGEVYPYWSDRYLALIHERV